MFVHNSLHNIISSIVTYLMAKVWQNTVDYQPYTVTGYGSHNPKSPLVWQTVPYDSATHTAHVVYGWQP